MSYYVAFGPFEVQLPNATIWRSVCTPEMEKAHITIAFNDFEIPDVEELQRWPDEITFQVVGEDMFGENHDIPVYLIDVVGLVTKDKIEQYHKVNNRRKDGSFSLLLNLHLTRKHLTLPEGAPWILPTGTLLRAVAIFVKKVGVDEAPVYYRPLTYLCPRPSFDTGAFYRVSLKTFDLRD